MPDFKQGDLVYHSFYGTGIITSIQTLDLSGDERLYYVVELAIGEVLMMPIEQAEDARLHPLISPDVITDVLSAKPEELADDARRRREHIEGKINGGDPTQVAEALRDLIWREHTAHLSNGDRKLMGNARKLLANILVMQPDLDTEEASQRLDAMLEKTTLAWGQAGD